MKQESTNQKNKFSVVASIALLTVLFSLLGTLVITIVSWGENRFTWSHWSVFLLSWLSITIVAIHKEKNPISPLWVLFTYLLTYFFFRPLFVLISEGGFLFGISSQAVTPNMFFLSSIFVVFVFFSFTMGYSITKYNGNLLAVGFPRPPEKGHKTILTIMTWSMLGTSLLSYLYVVIALGGISYVISNQAALVLAIPEKGTAVKIAWTMLYLYFAGATLMLVRYGPGKAWYLVLIIGVLIFLTLGRRSPLLGLLVPLIVYRHFYVRKLTLAKGAIGGGLLFGLFILISVIRFYTASRAKGLSGGGLLETAEFFVWDMNMAILSSFGDAKELRLGLDFLPYWLRSSLHFDRHFISFHAIGEAQVDLFFNGFPAGIPSGIFGTLYMNWGWIGIFIGSFVMGWSSKVIQQYFALNSENKLLVLLGYPFFLAAFFYTIRLGDFWLGISTQGRVAAFLVFFILIITGFRVFRGRSPIY